MGVRDGRGCGREKKAVREITAWQGPVKPSWASVCTYRPAPPRSLPYLKPRCTEEKNLIDYSSGAHCFTLQGAHFDGESDEPDGGAGGAGKGRESSKRESNGAGTRENLQKQRQMTKESETSW